jgi:hypothetical protein
MEEISTPDTPMTNAPRAPEAPDSQRSQTQGRTEPSAAPPPTANSDQKFRLASELCHVSTDTLTTSGFKNV